jgi:FHS family glucose/mannose:H+ symporter-like MFS transporter
LGAFFAVGALGMPFVLGILKHQFPFEAIVSSVGFLAFLAAVIFFLIKFPPPKLTPEIPFSRGLILLKDKVLILIAFFLFCQSSFEGIINNWTTTYLIDELAVEQSNALYALSLYVVGMAVMRLLIASVLRPVAPQRILYLSFGLLLAGCIFLAMGNPFPVAVAGLILIGAGLAAGFPLMLGFVGDRYTELSGTAFSFVLVIALIGNMAVNFLMGIIAERFGIHHLTTVAFCELTIMVFLSWKIINKNKRITSNETSYVSKTMA